MKPLCDVTPRAGVATTFGDLQACFLHAPCWQIVPRFSPKPHMGNTTCTVEGSL